MNNKHIEFSIKIAENNSSVKKTICSDADFLCVYCSVCNRYHVVVCTPHKNDIGCDACDDASVHISLAGTNSLNDIRKRNPSGRIISFSRTETNMKIYYQSVSFGENDDATFCVVHMEILDHICAHICICPLSFIVFPNEK